VIIRLSAFKSMTFDCYGTLVDWEAALSKALEAWAGQEGLTISGPELLELFSQCDWVNERKKPDMRYSDVLRLNLRTLADRLGRTVRPHEDSLLVDAVKTAEPFPDTVESLQYLQRFFKIGILSNTDHEIFFGSTSPKLQMTWDLVVTAEDVGAYKPEKPQFSRAMELLEREGIKPAEMLHLGVATIHDCFAAKAFGFGGAVWVDRYSQQRGQGAAMFLAGAEDLRVASLAELVQQHQREAATTGLDSRA